MESIAREMQEVVQKLQETGGQEIVSQLKASLAKKSYALDRGFLKTVLFPSKVKKGARYPDFSPVPSCIFPMNFEVSFNLDQPVTEIFIDPEIADPNYTTVAIFDMGHAPVKAATGMGQMILGAAEGERKAPKLESVSVSPYCLFEGVRMIGCEVQAEFLGGTAFGNGFLANSTIVGVQTDADLETSYVSSVLQPAEKIELLPAASKKMIRHAFQGIVAGAWKDNEGVPSAEQLKFNGMYGTGDFASGIRVWVPPAKSMVFKTLRDQITSERRVIRGSIQCDAIRSGDGDLLRSPSVRFRIFRWFEGTPKITYLRYMPTEVTVPSYATREYLEMIHRNMPTVFTITPRDLDEKYKYYKQYLGLGTVID